MLDMSGRRKTDHSGLVGQYSNLFSIGFNGYMFIFDFGMTNAVGTALVYSRIVTSPADAEEFLRLLSRSLDEHANKYGPLTKAGDTAPFAPTEPSVQ